MNYSKKAHAQHNERTCKDLHTSGKAPDWVVTIAFYSALQYAQNEIFPLQDGNKTFISFDNYYQHLGNNRLSKHEETIYLVYEEFGDDAGAAYKELYNKSSGARYRNFMIKPEVVERCIELLEELKTYFAK